MANTNHSRISAARRRELAQKQHQQEQRRNSRRGKGRQQKPTRTNPWLVIGGILALLVVIVAVFWAISTNQKNTTETAAPGVFQQVTSLNPNLLATVGTGNVKDNVNRLLKPIQGAPLLKGPDGKPEVFYMGGDFCPYCAAQRWGLIVALSRFGSFKQPLQANIASEGNVPTFSFHGSSYQSQYIDFVPREVENNQGNQLDTLTATEQQMVNKYDAPPYSQTQGGFPFINIANQHVASGAFYDYNLLVGQQYPDIVRNIQDTNSTISQGVLGTANYLTASICAATNNQPANVCTTSSITQIQATLPKVSARSDPGTHAGAINAPVVLTTRRENYIFG
jgi:Domain of unknown function (DUF929)